jgi:hypothetical protein
VCATHVWLVAAGDNSATGKRVQAEQRVFQLQGEWENRAPWGGFLEFSWEGR